MINMGLSTPTLFSLPQEFVSAMVGFLTGHSSPTTAQLEQAFRVYMYIDIGLIVVCVVSLIVEVRSIFTIAPKRRKSKPRKGREIIHEIYKEIIGTGEPMAIALGFLTDFTGVTKA